MFHRGVAVCSGAGIGAVASTCIQHTDWFLIWIGPELEKTYGREILDLLERTIPPERRLLWDTRGPLGRPDIFSLISRTYRDWDAEGMSLLTRVKVFAFVEPKAFLSERSLICSSSSSEQLCYSLVVQLLTTRCFAHHENLEFLCL